MMNPMDGVAWWQKPLLWLVIYLVILVTWMLDPGHPRIAGVFHDDGIYMCLGESLVERGVYRDNHTPEPIQIAKYPPGEPTLIALARGLSSTPEGLISWLRLVHALFLGLGLWALLGLLRGEGEGATRLAPYILATMAISPPLLDLMRIPMSEIPYLGITLFALYYLCTCVRTTERPGRHGTILALLCLLAFTFRSVGGTLSITTLVYLLLARRRRTALRFSLCAFPLLAGLQLFLTLHSSPAAGYEDITIYGLPYGKIMAEGLDYLPRVLGHNLCQSGLHILYGLIPLTSLFKLLTSTAGSLVVWAGVLVTLSLLALGVRREWQNPPDRNLPRLRPWHLHILLSLLLVIPWPFQISRFLVPLSPFFLLLVLQGMTALAGRRAALITALLILTTTLCGGMADRLDQRPGKFTLFGQTRDYGALFSVGRDLTKRLKPDAVVASTVDPLLAVHFKLKGVWGWTIRNQVADLYGGDDRKWQSFFMDLDRWQRGSWLFQELGAAQAFYMTRSGRQAPPGQTLPQPAMGTNRSWLLAEMEKDQALVEEQFKRLGVTHAVILLQDGQHLYDVLLARLVRKLAGEKRAFPLTAAANATVQVWRLRL